MRIRFLPLKDQKLMTEEIRSLCSKKLSWYHRNSLNNLIKNTVRINIVLSQLMLLTDRQIHYFISENEEKKLEAKVKNRYKQVRRFITLKFVNSYSKKYLTSRNVLNWCLKIFRYRRYPFYSKMTSFTMKLCCLFSICYLGLMLVNYIKCKKVLIVKA